MQSSVVSNVEILEALAIFETLESRNQDGTSLQNVQLPTQPMQYHPRTDPSIRTNMPVEAERNRRQNEQNRKYRKRRKEAELRSQNVTHNVSHVLPAVSTTYEDIFQNDFSLNQHVRNISPSGEFWGTNAVKMEMDIEESPAVKTEDSTVKIEFEESMAMQAPNDECCIFEKKFGPKRAVKILRTLEDEYTNKEHSNMKILDDKNNFVISIFTPFMRRVSEKLKQSSEILFVDFMSSVDTMDCKVVVVMTNSIFTGLPVAVIVTSSNTCEAITEGFKMIQGLLSPTSFGGRGKKGPILFLTRREYKTERAALLNVFPEARLLFCQAKALSQMRNLMKKCKCYPINRETCDLPTHIRVLQNEFQALIYENDANVINQKVDDFMQSLTKDPKYVLLNRETYGSAMLPAHKRALLNMLESLIHESDADVVRQKVDELLNHEFMISYPEFHIHLRDFLADIEGWAECHRVNLITRGQDTNDIGVAGAKVINHVMRPNYKAKSPVELLKILINNFQNDFISRIIRLSNFGPSSASYTKCIQLHKNGEKLVYSAAEKTVLESDTMRKYTIDLELGLCPCSEGANGMMCVHLFKALADSDNETLLNFPRTDHERSICYYVATGSYFQDENYKGNLNPNESIPRSVLGNQEQTAHIRTDSVTPGTNDNVSYEGPVVVKVEPEEEAFAYGCTFDEVNENAMQDECVIDEIDDMLIDLKSKISENPALWTAVNELISSYKQIQSITDLESAMSSFGKQGQSLASEEKPIC